MNMKKFIFDGSEVRAIDTVGISIATQAFVYVSAQKNLIFWEKQFINYFSKLFLNSLVWNGFAFLVNINH